MVEINNNESTQAATEQVARVSNLSRARAANGDPNLSAETQEAVKNGAIPPVVAEPSDSEATKSDRDVAKPISGDSDGDSVSDVAVEIATTGTVGNRSGGGDIAAPISRDAATAALGNTVDIVV